MNTPVRASGLLAGLLLGLAVVPAAGAYKNGDPVVITGVVTDGQGLPLPQVIVTLEASRAGFSLRSFHRQKQNLQRLSATTNPRGEYSLAWPWSDYYNNFELVVGVHVRKPDRETFQVLQRLDISRRFLGGSPVVAALAVQDTSFLNTLRQFVAGLKTADEQKLYGEMGLPDAVDRLGAPAYVESTWWFFESGKAYRFRDGKLAEVVPFDPVKRF